jgi:phosphomevalonate kinase
VSYVLSFLQLTTIPDITVTILADNDYYSQSSSPTYTHLVSLPRFNNLDIPIAKANKTGLGSSAALITSLTAALITFLSDIVVTSEHGKRIVHNLAQAAHCAAQGKVGSGFDIAAAVYGSCVYKRFDPKILEDILLDSEQYDVAFQEKLRDIVNQRWEMQVSEFRLPVGLRVVMGDVAAGSATPSMVRSVLKWKSSSPGAEGTWKSLGGSNEKLIELFNQLKKFTDGDIKDELCLGMYNRRRRHSDLPVYKVLNAVTQQFDVADYCLI